MPFKKGEIATPNGRSKQAHESHAKLTAAINNALERIKSGKKIGVDALSDRIARAIEDDVMGSLAVLSRYMPKALDISVTRHTALESMTDGELGDLIASRARALRDVVEPIDVTPDRVIEGD